jgi:hypothetical protein
LDHYQEPESFRANLNATIEALRNVTFKLQNEKSAFAEFDVWYKPQQQQPPLEGQNHDRLYL